MEIEYVGERLLPGQLGNAFLILSFVASLVAAIAYFFAEKDQLGTSWKNTGRWAFRIHFISVLGMIGTLFWMLFNHYFEYEYVWHHSNTAMPMRYIMSCFWEGQEGSFLLWIFWQSLLGLILIRSAKDFEAPVMSVVSLAQAFLGTMLLGVYVLDYKLGSNPFTVLLREMPDSVNMPLFTNTKAAADGHLYNDYLSKLDGRGLNLLLQNYWMTIHPPTLFLGFALTLVPFAYAIAGLWTKRLHEWQTPALPWTFFGVMVLGTGILMGGAWAYEALSFGGFWAWDPVENASLVPWLTFVASAHVMIISRKKGGSLYATFLLTSITYILILYSTFLTRSGILGDTSVHSFTDLGLLRQLLFYLLFFVALTIYLLLLDKQTRLVYGVLCLLIFTFLFFVPGAASVSSITFAAVSLIALFYGYFRFFPKETEEEDLWSREFWMFIGALVLVISSCQIILETSQPVINKIFGWTKAPRKDAIAYYNQWQVAFAILVALLIATGQFFRFKKTEIKVFLKKISLSFALSALLSGLMMWGLGLKNVFYCTLLFCSVFAVLANMDYFIRVLKGSISKAGASVAHAGFGLILLGVLISTSKKDIISINTSGKDIESLGTSNKTNILLNQGDTLKMGDYFVTYTSKDFEGPNVYFNIEYYSKDAAGVMKHEFTLRPRLQTSKNENMGMVPEPDTRHFLHKDIYTHVTFVEPESLKKKKAASDEYGPPSAFSIKRGDSLFSSNSIIVLEEIDTKRSLDSMKRFGITEGDIWVVAKLKAVDIKKKLRYAEPVYVIRGNETHTILAEIKELGLRFAFEKVDPNTGTFTISLMEKNSNKQDFIVMEAIIFPWINVLWLGCIIMIIGTVIAVIERIRKLKHG